LKIILLEWPTLDVKITNFKHLTLTLNLMTLTKVKDLLVFRCPYQP
jgi:hypothetical protein